MHDLEVILAREALVLDNLDPITIRVQQESHILHTTVREPLLPIGIERLKSLARSFNIIDRNACVSVSL